MKKTQISLALLFLSIVVSAQTYTGTTKDNAINIFIDVDNIQYIKENITFVNYVRDDSEADVHILETKEETGNGGRKYSYIFTGSKSYSNQNDTLYFFTKADDSTDEIREKQVKILKLGLIQYVAHSPYADKIEISFDDAQQSTTDPVDKWKNWVFELNLNSYTNGESYSRNIDLWTNFGISKITEEWKIILEFGKSYNKSFFFIESDTITSETNSNSSSFLIAKSIDEHWSYGVRGNIGNSSYNNKKLYSSFYPTIEYNIFPYSKSNIVQFRFQYSAGPTYNIYYDTTIFNKTEELLYHQTLAAAFKINKKWGSINSSVSAQSYFHDFSKNRLNFRNSVSVRLFKGFSLNINGSYAIIHDQLYLPKAGMNTEQILLQQQQNSTSFSYWIMFGFSYTFGSIYNNVVNPRFDYIY